MKVYKSNVGLKVAIFVDEVQTPPESALKKYLVQVYESCMSERADEFEVLASDLDNAYDVAHRTYKKRQVVNPSRP